MDMKYTLILTLAALVALIHEGQSLDCFACNSHSWDPVKNSTKVEVDICASKKDEIGGPVKGAVVVTCNATAGENACFKSYTYAFSASTKEQVVTMNSRGCMATETKDVCKHNDGYQAKTDLCFCSGNKCNGAQGLSTSSISLAAGLVGSVLLLLSRH